MRKIVLLLVCVLLAMPVLSQTTLNGAGATFPYPIYSKWFSEYHKLHSDIQINYQSIGSGGGIRQVTAGTVDFGASDMPMTDKQLAEFKGKILNLPTVLGAVVPAYNVPGVSGEVKFTPEALAGIFLGRSPSGMTRRSLRPIPESISPIATSSLYIAPTAAAPASSGPTTCQRSVRNGRVPWAPTPR